MNLESAWCKLQGTQSAHTTDSDKHSVSWWPPVAHNVYACWRSAQQPAHYLRACSQSGLLRWCGTATNTHRMME